MENSGFVRAAWLPEHLRNLKSQPFKLTKLTSAGKKQITCPAMAAKKRKRQRSQSRIPFPDGDSLL
jgi:hypothetical protein